MDPLSIIEKYYAPRSKAYHFLVGHSEMVADKALRIAKRVRHLNPDSSFVGEAAMLHDIAIFLTDEPAIGCYGSEPYIRHGFLGREILDREGFLRHALVCERHVGAGISKREIEEKNLPLPKRDMLPITIEEQIICYADKFFSKTPEFLLKEKPLDKVRQGIAKFGEDKLKQFDDWLNIFGE